MEGLFSSVNTIWVLLAAALVFFMQAGFAMVESGFTRAKNAGNIIMKNIADFAFGTVGYWLLGFGLMFGGSSLFFGMLDPGIRGDYSGMLPEGVPLMAFVIFQSVFCATAATIVSGAMAERTKFSAYCIYSVIISAVIYPISGHWAWGGGWLSSLGFHDFAGSSVVHMVGGIAALVGAAIVGPRIGKYGANGKPKAILGHNLTLGALGVFILWFGWFGFNAGSTVGATGDDTLVSMSSIFFNTNLAAACGTITAMFITWILYKKTDVSLTLNGALGGLVAITAGCDAVSPFGAALIGGLAGLVVVGGIRFIDKVLKIDDPVGAFSVHGICGALGTILVGAFAMDGGLFYGGGFSFMGTQLLGVGAIAVWAAATMLIIFTVLKHTVGLRVTRQEEIHGLDIVEHNLASSYADFMLNEAEEKTGVNVSLEAAPAKGSTAVPVSDKRKKEPGEAKMTKMVIITKEDRFDALKHALDAIGITGMTVSQVMGYGVQKGATDYYRGVPLEVQLVPNVQVEIVISTVPVDLAVETAKKAVYTGSIGDGKIFLYDVENTIRIRTGEEGVAALQDTDE